jgi:hypothetical protein
MSVTALASKKADERAALRHAVVAAAKAQAAVVAHCDAIEKARELVAEAEGKLRVAAKAVEAARQDSAQQIAAALVGGGGSPANKPGVRAARVAEQFCEDDVEAAKGAVATLAADLADLESDATRAAGVIDTALAEALRPLASRLLEDVRGHRLRFLRSQAALRMLGRLWNSWDDIVKEIDRTSSINDADMRLAIVVEQEWQAALAALKVDADAPLPNLAGD